MSRLLRRAFMGSGGKTYATWNPADKAASFSLSGGDLVVTMTPTVGQIRSTIGKSSGKWYWEYLVGVNTTGPIVGMATSAASLAAWTGFEASSWGLYGPTGNKYTNNVATACIPYSTVDIIGCALDMDAGTIEFYVNGVLGSGMFSGVSGTVYAAAGQSGANSPTVTANFGATAFAHPPPGGYNAGLYV